MATITPAPTKKNKSVWSPPTKAEDLPVVDTSLPAPIWQANYPKRHEIATRYPLMSWAEIGDMVRLIETGTTYDVYLAGEEDIDGSNAFIAHCLARKLPNFKQVKGEGKVLERFVYRRNSIRRMLSPVERARIALLHLEALGWEDLNKSKSPSSEGTREEVDSTQPDGVSPQLRGKSKKSKKARQLAITAGVSEITAERALEARRQETKGAATRPSKQKEKSPVVPGSKNVFPCTLQDYVIRNGVDLDNISGASLLQLIGQDKTIWIK